MAANTSTPLQTLAQNRILSLLDSLPPESLPVVEQFVRFLREQSRQGQPVTMISEQERQPPYRYPSVPLPASVLDSLVGIAPPIGGDALSDTEALYDEA